MDEAGTRSYPNVLAYVSRTPWAITGEAFGVVKEVLTLHLNGWRPSVEEAQAAEKLAASRPTANRVGAVAVIPLQGVLVPRASMFTAMSGGTSMEAFSAAITAAANDPAVAQIVLDVDSPGGVSDMIQETAAVIRWAAEQKPVTAVVNTECGSAAWWLASQATSISITPSGYIGSQGVFSIHTDVSGSLQNRGINTTIIKATASPYKAELNPFGPLSPEALAYVQSEIDGTCEAFIADVAIGRGVDADYAANEFGQGRMISASDAVTVGMADRIETYSQALDRILGRPDPRRTGSQGSIHYGPTPAASEPDKPDEPRPDRATDKPTLVPGAEALLARPGFRKAISNGR